MSVEFIHCSRAKLSGVQLSTFYGWTIGPRGPTVRPQKVDSWAPDSLALEQCINSTDIYVFKMLAAFIYYKYIILKMYIPQPCAQRAHRKPSTDIYPPNVGRIYPIQKYILQNAHSLTLRPKGTQKTSQNVHFLTRIQYQNINSTDMYSSN